MGPILVKFRVSLEPKMGKVSNYVGAGPGPGCPTSVKIGARLGKELVQVWESDDSMEPIWVVWTENGPRTELPAPVPVKWRRTCPEVVC